MKYRKRKIDFSDELMLNWSPRQRTIRFGLILKDPSKWSVEFIEESEEAIRYDLNFDGYSVRIIREFELALNFNGEFRWKLIIRTR